MSGDLPNPDSDLPNHLFELPNHLFELYLQIWKAIPKNLFQYKDSIEEAAINIYLTACGVRPACIPFDGEVRYGGYGSNIMIQKLLRKPEKLDALRAIPGITVHIGPYYDVGTTIVVAHSDSKLAHNIIGKLNKIESIHGNKRSDLPEIHILMGRLLGYLCPMDITELHVDTELYEVGYQVGARTYMSAWCLVGSRFTNKAVALLETINDALRPLGKTATLYIKPTRR